MQGDTLNKTRYGKGNNHCLSNGYGCDPDPVNGFICRQDYMCGMAGKGAIGITANCENSLAACRFIAYCASPEGRNLLLWGIEGRQWRRVDGVRTPSATLWIAGRLTPPIP